MDRIEDRVLFNGIRYANCWEDANVLCEALKPETGKIFLSIASAGDNSLSLLAGGARVVAVDLNPAQLACLELRAAAIKYLDYETCLGFLGYRSLSDRLVIYDRLKKWLSPSYALFWERNQNLLENGLIHQGRFEYYFRIFRKYVLPLVHSTKAVAELLREKEFHERIRFYHDQWNSFRWKLMFRIFFSKLVMGRVGRDPEFFRYVEGAVAEKIFKRTEYALTHLSTHDNPYLAYILTGNFNHTLPHYLLPENFVRIKNSLDNLTLFEGDVLAAVEKHGQDGFDGFNLSDIFEYLDIATCRHLYRVLLEKSKPNARFAYWNMLVERTMSQYFKETELLNDLSEKLFAADKAFFYSRFVVETIAPALYSHLNVNFTTFGVQASACVISLLTIPYP